MMALLLFILVAGEPHPFVQGPYANAAECEVKRLELVAEAEKERAIDAYGMACVPIVVARAVPL